jgi:cysteine-rich repeat protein
VNTEFDGLKNRNPCLISPQLSSPTDFYIYQNDDCPEVYPTSRGWALLKSDTWVLSDWLDFGDLHQFSFGFTVFPFTNTFSFEVFLIDMVDNLTPIKIEFRENEIKATNPSASTTFSYIRAQQWNRVIISVFDTDSADQIRIECYISPLLESTDPSNIIEAPGVYTSKSYNGLFGSKIRIGFYKSGVILKNIGYYKYAINEQYLKDLGSYKYGDDVDFDFQSEFYDEYYKYFDNKSASFKIDNSTNEWISYFPSDLSFWRDLSRDNETFWVQGFTETSVFWMDTWGDGSVQLSPQVYQCDDGNNLNGDGCSENWKIEENYECEIISALNNKSYWYSLCGNGVYQPTIPEECDDGNQFSNDGWENDCTIVPGFKWINFLLEPSLWFPNWGDGIRDTSPTVETCDDGNNLDNDGCNKEWQIEDNYICSPGGGGADVCTTIFPRPVIVDDSIDITSSKITIKFDQEMNVYNVTEEDVFISISGPNSPYSVTWTSQFKNALFEVSYAVSPPILGGVGEAIQIVLANVKVFKSSNLIPMSSPQTFNYEFGELEASQGTQSGGQGASFTFIFTILLSIGISILTGGSMELMWSFANTLQLIFFLGLLNLYYSSDLKAIFGFMKYSNFENPLSKYMTKYITSFASFVQSPVSAQFGDLGFESTNIILNSFDKIILVGLLVTTAILLACLVRAFKKKKSCTGRLVKKMDLSIRYESMTRFFIEIMLVVSIAAFINLTFGSMANFEDILSYLLACFALFCILMLTLYAFGYPMVFMESIVKYPDYHERHAILFLEFKQKHLKWFYYYAYFLVRRLAFSFVLVCMKDFPKNQVVMILLLGGWIAAYQIFYQPFKETLQNVLSTFNELIFTAFAAMLFNFLKSNDPIRLKVSSV